MINNEQGSATLRQQGVSLPHIVQQPSEFSSQFNLENRPMQLSYSQQELLNNLDAQKVLEVFEFAKQMENTA